MNHDGIGLGLTIVKQIVEKSGGNITVQSAGIGEGSCFTISMKMERQYNTMTTGWDNSLLLPRNTPVLLPRKKISDDTFQTLGREQTRDKEKTRNFIIEDESMSQNSLLEEMLGNKSQEVTLHGFMDSQRATISPNPKIAAGPSEQSEDVSS